VGIEAAHVRWFAFDRPDALDNGLALCALDHKLFDLNTWSRLLDSGRPGSRYRSLVESWGGGEYREVVNELSACLDQEAGPPSASALAELEPIYRNVALWELGFWEMCWSGQNWPELETKS
jgi:hypothetical protein